MSGILSFIRKPKYVAKEIDENGYTVCFDKRQVYTNCTVVVYENTNTGQQSHEWKRTPDTVEIDEEEYFNQ